MENVNAKLEELYEIEKGKGVQHILDRTREIMGNPALVFDMEYRLIASPANAVNDDPIWCEFMKYGKLGKKTIEFFKNESFIDSVANCTQFDGVTYLLSNNLKYNRIFGQVYNKAGLPVIDLVMVECESEFEEDTPELIRAVCNIITEEISRDEHYKSYGQSYQDSIIEQLIDGDIDDKEIYAGHVSNIDRGLKSNIFIAVAKVPLANPSYTYLAFYRDMLKQEEPAYKYSIYSGYIIILISSDNPVIKIRRELKNLIRPLERRKMKVGISDGFDNLFELRKHYLEAVCVLNSGKVVNGGLQISLYEKRPAAK